MEPAECYEYGVCHFLKEFSEVSKWFAYVYGELGWVQDILKERLLTLVLRFRTSQLLNHNRWQNNATMNVYGWYMYYSFCC